MPQSAPFPVATCNALCSRVKWAPGTPESWVVANPCFGLDFAAVDFIHSQLLDARNQGVAILLVCEDLDELLSLSDRVVVMAGGRLVYDKPIAEAGVQEIGEKMAGH